MIKIGLKAGLTAVLLGALLVPGAASALSAADPTSVAAALAPASNDGLTEHIRAAVKNASATPTEKGYRLSVTVRLYNGGDEQARVPEHELRVRTRTGVTYTLAPSAGNKTALQPKEIAEQVCSALVDSKEVPEWDHLSFIHVNPYVYPKIETERLTMPVGAVWYGAGRSAPVKPARLAWGTPFRLPGVHSEIVYTPVEASIQQTAEGRGAVVTLLAENTGAGRETVPSFRIDAVAADAGTHEGVRAEKDAVALEAGEKAYLHFVVPLDPTETPTDLLAVSTDTFVGAGGEEVVVSTGKWLLSWPPGGQAAARSPSYEPGQPIVFDALTKAIDEQTEVSLAEFHIHDNPGEGYRTAVAKFRLVHHGDLPVAAPVFGSELTNDRGVSYRGSRQSNAIATMNPGLGYVISYSYMLPRSDESGEFTMKLVEGLTAVPYTTTVAAVPVRAQGEEDNGRAVSVYPFELKLNSVQVGFLYNAGTYKYKFNLDLEIEQLDNIVVDGGFSRIRFEVVDNVGRIVGSQDAVLAGDKKLISGKQVLEASELTSDQLHTPFTINVYEVFDTESGTAKRLLKRVK
ncbi:hypothetical protein [Paenibacillus flagellatus]|uniref:Copper amine oxidase-like N-terminal domain-containing protein n=1 Tax=Paenibacillus flagellatus TaxID=2211139 RepID=A0A2V5K6H2_9BACL|nr:hypothetical protein [Paenibacillus flagellatus]PYI53363.1 hypothetical protein DLM86_16390 [Paenibacillus flagellatus]